MCMFVHVCEFIYEWKHGVSGLKCSDQVLFSQPSFGCKGQNPGITLCITGKLLAYLTRKSLQVSGFRPGVQAVLSGCWFFTHLSSSLFCPTSFSGACSSCSGRQELSAHILLARPPPCKQRASSLIVSTKVLCVYPHWPGVGHMLSFEPAARAKEFRAIIGHCGLPKPLGQVGSSRNTEVLIRKKWDIPSKDSMYLK